MEHDEKPGMDRRDLLKRGAVVGGALVWTAPLVQTITSPAFATGSLTGQEIPCTRFTGSPVRFKVEREDSKFVYDNGTGGGCVLGGMSAPEGSNTIPGTSSTVSASFSGFTGTITVPADFALADFSVKAGDLCFQNDSPGVTVTPALGTGNTGLPTTYTIQIPAGSGNNFPSISHIDFAVQGCA